MLSFLAGCTEILNSLITGGYADMPQVQAEKQSTTACLTSQPKHEIANAPLSEWAARDDSRKSAQSLQRDLATSVSAESDVSLVASR